MTDSFDQILTAVMAPLLQMKTDVDQLRNKYHAQLTEFESEVLMAVTRVKFETAREFDQLHQAYQVKLSQAKQTHMHETSQMQSEQLARLLQQTREIQTLTATIDQLRANHAEQLAQLDQQHKQECQRQASSITNISMVQSLSREISQYQKQLEVSENQVKSLRKQLGEAKTKVSDPPEETTTTHGKSKISLKKRTGAPELTPKPQETIAPEQTVQEQPEVATSNSKWPPKSNPKWPPKSNPK